MNQSIPQLSIIFPSLNGKTNDILDLLISIQKSIYPKGKLEVLIVDNGSKKNNIMILQNLYKKVKPLIVKIILNKTNLGFAKAVNKAAKVATGEFLFITNNDVKLQKKCLLTLIRLLQTDPSIGIVGPKVYSYTSNKDVKGALKFNFYTGLFKVLPNINDSQETDWVPGCGMCCSKKVWKALNGFDEGFFFIGEDLDLCLRAKYKGYKVIFHPKAKIWHRDGATVNRREFSKMKYFEGYKSKLRLILKHASTFQILSAFLLQIIVYMPFRLLILKERSAIPLIQAFLWNIKKLPETISIRKKVHERYSY